MMPIQRINKTLHADPKRRIIRPIFHDNAERIQPVFEYVMSLSQQEAMQQLEYVRSLFQHRHPNFSDMIMEQGQQILKKMESGPSEPALTALLGSYFLHEYTVESAALFNPSIVRAPSQEGVKDGSTRFILSLRATGEGHISSIAFQQGEVNNNGEITLGARPEAGITGQKWMDKDQAYRVEFTPDSPLESRILFPFAPAECNGMEDARFVWMEDQKVFLGTYTAYNGHRIQPHLIETSDFREFNICPLRGMAASDKGMAIFPEKIGGNYAMVGRQGGRILTYMTSENLHEWHTYAPLQSPVRGWEMLQMGNCGSPVKTPKGWLLLTHAVGPMRRYVLSMTLLDGEDPSRVLASLPLPLMEPLEHEREGYVPNVLYTCGMMKTNDMLLIPYAMSDSAIGFATADTEEILHQLAKEIR